MTNRKDPSLWDLFLIISLGIAIGLVVLVMGCSPDVSIAKSPACECCGPDCDCEKCECER